MRYFLSVVVIFLSTGLWAQPGVSEKVVVDGRSYYKHLIKEGETVYAIHKLYDVAPEEIQSANPGSENGIRSGEYLLIPIPREFRYEQHVVAKKETIYGICKKYDVESNDLMEANPELSEGLKEGQIIRIPIEIKGAPGREKELAGDNLPRKDTIKIKGGTHIIYKDSLVRHVVQRRETLFSLSKRYMVKQEDIREANNGLLEGLKKGDTINIPLRIEIDTVLIKDIVKDDTIQKLPQHKEIFYKDVYNVVLLAPFDLDKNIQRNQNLRVGEEAKVYGPTKVGVDFYAGVKLALDSLKKAGISINFSVFDTRNDTNEVKRILKENDLKEADLIIGPFFKKNVDVVARFAKENKIHMVIPVPQGNKVLYKNPYVSKVVTSTTTKIKGMAAYIVANYPDANIILVDSKKENESYMFTAMQDALVEELEKSNAVVKTPVISSVENYSAKHLHASISKSKPNIVIACSKDQGFAANFMTKLNGIKNSWDKYSAEITVFVLDDWERFNSIDPLAKNKLNMHFVASSYIAYDSTETKEFIKVFRNEFGYDPEQFGFMGFDLAYNYIAALSHMGSGFNEGIGLIHGHGIHTKFDLIQVQAGSGFENKSIYIVKYKDYDLIPEEW